MLSQQRYESLLQDGNSLMDRERSLKGQVELLSEDKSKIQQETDSLFNKNRNLSHENTRLKNELESLNDENARFKDQLKYSTSETIKWRNTAESDVFALKMVEERANLLSKEKKNLENLLGKLQNIIPIAELQRIIGEFIKIHSEIEMSEREKIRLENQLLSLEVELRNCTHLDEADKINDIRREIESLRSQLSRCDYQIEAYKRRLSSLEDDLKNQDKRRTLKREEVVIDYNQDLVEPKKVTFSQSPLNSSFRDQRRINRYDPLISHNFAPNIESRLLKTSPQNLNPLRSTKNEI